MTSCCRKLWHHNPLDALLIPGQLVICQGTLTTVPWPPVRLENALDVEGATTVNHMGLSQQDPEDYFVSRYTATNIFACRLGYSPSFKLQTAIPLSSSMFNLHCVCVRESCVQNILLRE
jgi:hypothetical protein